MAFNESLSKMMDMPIDRFEDEERYNKDEIMFEDHNMVLMPIYNAEIYRTDNNYLVNQQSHFG
jgi:hypothetical protein